MFSTLDRAGATATLDALAAGATDYVTKPATSAASPSRIEAVREQLVPRIYALVRADERAAAQSRGPSARCPSAPSRPVRRAAADRSPDRPARAGSTSSLSARRPAVPSADQACSRALPADFPVRSSWCSTCRRVFTRMFAERLDRSCALQRGRGRRTACRSTPGMVVHRAGRSASGRSSSGAPNGHPAQRRRRRRTPAAPRWMCCSARWPRSTATSALAVVLTGMGHDGRSGCEELPRRRCRGDRSGRGDARWCGACPGRWSTPASPTSSCRWPTSAPISIAGSIAGRFDPVEGGDLMTSLRRGLRVRRALGPPRGGDRARAGQGIPGRGAADRRSPARQARPSVSEFLAMHAAASEPGRAPQAIVDALTTNETSWFRDREPFTALTEHVLPELIQARAATRTLRLWSAACSSGQEPYSLAITLQRVPAGRLDVRDLRRRDISTEMIKRAEAGEFSQVEVNRGLPAHDAGAQLRAGRRALAVSPVAAPRRSRSSGSTSPRRCRRCRRSTWSSCAMCSSTSMSRRRTSCCANVDQLLRPDGWLFLGAAETTIGIDDNYERVAAGRTSAYRLRHAVPAGAAGKG